RRAHYTGAARFGVLADLLIHPDETLAERVLRLLHLAEGQVAFVELSVRDALVDDPLDHAADRLGVLFGQRSHRGLGAVGEHDDAGLFAAGARAGIAEGALVGRVAALLRGFEEGLR